MKIGLIGVENSHARHFCKVINGNRPWDGVSIGCLFGADDPEEAKRLSDEYGIKILRSDDDVINASDAVIITYRKGSAHRAPAVKALKAGKPLFNDKPFTVCLKEAREITSLAASTGVPMTGGSSIKLLPDIADIKKTIRPGSAAVISYTADPASEYDGYWFYGIHSVELCLELFGLDFVSVSSFRNSDVVVSTVTYPENTCVIVTSPHTNGLYVSVTNAGVTECRQVPINIREEGPAEFVNMAKTGKPPRGYDFYVKSVELAGRIIETAGMA